MTASTDTRPNTIGFEDNSVRPAPALLYVPVLVVAVLLGAGLKWGMGWAYWMALPVAYAVYVIGVWAAYAIKAGSRQAVDQVMRALVYGAFILAVLPLASLLWTVFSQGLPFLFKEFDVLLGTDMGGVDGTDDKAYYEAQNPADYPDAEPAAFAGGLLHAVWGTLIITAMATLISVPVGMMCAIYLVEYSRNGVLARIIRFFVDVMTGIPSIVAGLFALALFAVLQGVGTKHGLSGAVALSTLMIPTVVRNSEEMLRIVPNELREAALALGVPQWRVVTRVVLPTAASGLASGVTLAIARIIGETAPLLVASGVTVETNTNPFSGAMNTLAYYSYQLFLRPLSPAPPYREVSFERAWAAVVVLVFIVVVLNLAARLIAKVFAPKTGRS